MAASFEEFLRAVLALGAEVRLAPVDHGDGTIGFYAHPNISESPRVEYRVAGDSIASYGAVARAAVQPPADPADVEFYAWTEPAAIPTASAPSGADLGAVTGSASGAVAPAATGELPTGHD